MSRYRGYEKYKDSGVEWLGEIPEHWEAVGLTKYLRSLVDYRGKTPEKKQDGVFLITAKNIKNGVIDYSLSQEFVREDEYDEIMRRGKPEIGDMILTTEAPLGEVANIDNINIALAQRIIKMQGKIGILNNYFLKYWMLGLSFSQNLQSLCTGSTALGIKASKFCLLKVVLPPLEEQETIARFLDYKTKQIDDLIAKKQTLLEKLDEKRTALIGQAVTKGLDRAVPMKDSGIEWLGEIPAHWEVKRLRFLMVMCGGSTPNKNNPEFWDGEIPWISAKDMKTERLISSIDTITEQALQETSIRLHEKGGIVIVVRGMILAHSFPVAINDIDLTINQDLKILKNSLNAEFLAILLRGIKNLVLSIMEESGHGTKVLRTDLFKNIFLPNPPLYEQQTIVNFVDQKTLEIDQQKTKIQDAIALLKEYRTALITNAVTGKIDVRQVPISQAKKSPINP